MWPSFGRWAKKPLARLYHLAASHQILGLTPFREKEKTLKLGTRCQASQAGCAGMRASGPTLVHARSREPKHHGLDGQQGTGAQGQRGQQGAAHNLRCDNKLPKAGTPRLHRILGARLPRPFTTPFQGFQSLVLCTLWSTSGSGCAVLDGGHDLFGFFRAFCFEVISFGLTVPINDKLVKSVQ